MWSLLVSVIGQCLTLCDETPGLPQGMSQLVVDLHYEIGEGAKGKKIRRRGVDWKADCTNELPSSRVDTTSETVQDLQAAELNDPVFIASAAILRAVPLLGMELTDGTCFPISRNSRTLTSI